MPAEERVPDVPFSPSDIVSDGDVVQTVVLDSKQHDELMALRAQQDVALKERFEKSVAVMFTDLVGSTAFYEKYGDLKGREKVLSHNALLFPLVQNAGGVIIKTIGDAIMACFDSVNDALAVSAAMQHTLAEHNRDVLTADDEIHVRIALNYGVAITQDGDIHGDVVNVAARIEHEAPPDQIWVSDSVFRESTGWPFESVGAVSFKGKAGKTALYRLDWSQVAKPEQGRGPLSLPPQYEAGEMISHGATGDTYRGTDNRSRRPVCIKGLHGFLVAEEKAREAFRHAAAAWAKLSHEGVVRVLDWSRSSDQEPFVITEFVPSVTLEQLVQRHGCPEPAYAALIVYRLAQILAYTHKQGVLHGDVKPECVLVTEAGQVRLIHFGMASVAASQVESTGAAIGNPAFMAPEQVVGAVCDARSDVYSLGALLYYLLCGRSPYESAGVQVTREVTAGGFTPIRRLNPEAPEALVSAVGRALSIVPEGRPEDVHRFAADLGKYFKAAGLDLQRDLSSFLTRAWPAQVAEVITGTFAKPKILTRTKEAARAKRPQVLEPSTRAATPAPTPFDSPPVDLDQAQPVLERSPHSRPRIGLPVAVVGAVLIAGLFFALGWKMGTERAQAALDQEAASALMPVAPDVDVAADVEGELAERAGPSAEPPSPRRVTPPSARPLAPQPAPPLKASPPEAPGLDAPGESPTPGAEPPSPEAEPPMAEPPPGGETSDD